MTLPPHDNKILKIESRTFSQICPGCLFEWHMNSKLLFVIRPIPNTNRADGIQIASNIKTPGEAKQAVAAYAQGYVHGKEDQGETPSERP